MIPFANVLPLILREEGGKVDNPHDPGGRTNFGITQDTYNLWRQSQGQLRKDVFLISSEEVASIYQNRYADPLKYDLLPPGVGYCVLDEAINSGVDRASRDLQTLLGVPVDGRIGAVTVGMANRWHDRKLLIDKLCDRRLGFLRRLHGWLTFGRGWTARVEFVRLKAKAMVVEVSNVA
jgi:lysozyme family protein